MIALTKIYDCSCERCGHVVDVDELRLDDRLGLRVCSECRGDLGEWEYDHEPEVNPDR